MGQKELPEKHSAYPYNNGKTMIQKWGGSLFTFSPSCLVYSVCPCFAYTTIGGFNTTDIESSGIKLSTTKRACFNHVAIGCAYYNTCCCCAQGIRRDALEMKLHTAADPFFFENTMCGIEKDNGSLCPSCKPVCLHLLCHPCAPLFSPPS